MSLSGISHKHAEAASHSSDGSAASIFSKSDGYKGHDAHGQTVEEGAYDPSSDAHKFKKLSWVQLGLLLLVEAVALGSLSLPGSFDTVGMAAGVIITFVVGLLTLYTAYVVGAASNKYQDQVHSYSDLSTLMWGKWGGELTGIAFVIFLTLANGSHALTGAIALETISDHRGCNLLWSGISAIVLFILALPKTFADQSWLGVADFISIIAAILITIIATGVSSHGGRGVEFHVATPSNPAPPFSEVIVAVVNIAFAFSFVVNQPSFMTELKHRKDFMKSVTLLVVAEWIIYILTGALIYAFVGVGVPSPALLASGHLVRRIGFGVALVVIFVSGSINTVAASRYLHHRIFKGTPHVYISTPLGYSAWVGIVFLLTAIGWVIAEAIPAFSLILSIISAVCVSGFSFYLPGFIWFYLLRDGAWNKDARNIALSVLNVFLIALGFFFFVGGIYGSAVQLKDTYQHNKAGQPFSCTWSSHGYA